MPIEPSKPIEPVDAIEEGFDEVIEIFAQAQKSATTLTVQVGELARSQRAVAQAQASNKKLTRAILILVALVTSSTAGLFFVALGNRDINRQNRALIAAINECTTAGPKTPTAEDPTTGNKCFDDGNSRGGALVDDLERRFDKQLDDLEVRLRGITPAQQIAEDTAQPAPVPVPAAPNN